MKRRNIVAKGFELSLMVGTSVAGVLDGLAKVSKSMSQVSESTKKLSTFDEARGKLNNLNEKYNKSSKDLKKIII